MARSHKHRPAPSMVPGLGGYVARNVGKHTSYPMRAAGTSPARPELARPCPPLRPPRAGPAREGEREGVGRDHVQACAYLTIYRYNDGSAP